MKALSEHSLWLMRAVAATLFDHGSGVQPERLDWMTTELREFSRRAGGRTRLAITVCLWILQLAPLLVVGRLARFTNLSPADKAHYLEKLEGGPFTLLFVPVKTVVCMHYYEHPAALAETGYDGKGLKDDVPEPERSVGA